MIGRPPSSTLFPSPTLSRSTIVTTPTPAAGTVGATLNDSATLALGVNPTGSILFKLFSPADPTCSGTPASATVYSQSVTVNAGNGTYSTSPGYVSTTPGTYHWTAAYKIGRAHV